MDEIYKDIDNNYAVSNHGNVVSKNTGKILKISLGIHGYNVVNFSYGGKKQHLIHRLVGNAFIPNSENKRNIDHIDNNRLNNHETNLRWATSQENNRNRCKKPNTSSEYKGVSFFKRDNNWRARIQINNKQIQLGYYDNEIEAARAYNQYIINHHLEEYCKLNEI